MIETLIGEIRPLVAAETIRAMEQHGKTYSSPHEAYAVLREEVEELAQEVDNIIEELILKDETRFGSLWVSTKQYDANQPALKSMLVCAYEDTIRNALHAAAEAIQVAAVATKALKSMDSWK